ncbi:hypothetical protein [Paraburkholderia adhaesiva]|uniref:hypothetical protein n=1 Tax=Paraburkholderia adhaesiva TaxID=2883244 RepID=UPI001F16FA43|nr:hypothetical protein [Paraburkholderia adhaesiva]
MMILHAALYVVLGVAAAWLVMLSAQPRYWRIVFGLILAGAWWNLTGLIWLHNARDWPGEPVITVACCLLLGGLLFARHPPVLRRPKNAAQ